MIQYSVFRPDVAVNSFAVCDATNGSSYFTDSTTVSVTSFTAEASPGHVIDGYAVNEDGNAVPISWLPTPPTTYTITGGQGLRTLYGWAKDEAGHVGSGSCSIVYSEAQVEVSGRQ